METKRTKFALYNMTGSLVYSLIMLFFRFLVRRLFLKYFGVTILGYNSTFNSVLNMLNLAELGVGTAITYNLYVPVANNDYAKINGYLAVYKKLYRYIGFFILGVGIVIIPILPLLVKEGYEKQFYLAVIFILQLLSTVSTYWCAYKRIVFNVYQNAYITYIVDTISFVIISVLQIIDIVYFENYIFYLFLAIAQVVISNVILSVWCDKKYKLKERENKEKVVVVGIKELKVDIGNVLMSKLGGYVLHSTDALVVSIIMGAVSTGYMTNYTTIFNSFQTMALTMMTSLQPSLGNKIACGDSTKEIEKTVLKLTYLSHLIGCVFSVVAYFLVDDFIQLWIGKEYTLNEIIAGLFALNVYIFLTMYPISLLFGALGYFKYDKIVVFIAAILNLVVSVILVYRLGIQGALIGTTLALMIYWISRTIILYRKYYQFSVLMYVKKVIRCVGTTAVSIIAILIMDNYVFCDAMSIASFVTKGSLYVAIVCVINVFMFFKTPELTYMTNAGKGILRRILYRR